MSIENSTAANSTAPSVTVRISSWLSSDGNADQRTKTVIIRGRFEGAAARATYIGIAMLTRRRRGLRCMHGRCRADGGDRAFSCAISAECHGTTMMDTPHLRRARRNAVEIIRMTRRCSRKTALGRPRCLARNRTRPVNSSVSIEVESRVGRCCNAGAARKRAPTGRGRGLQRHHQPADIVRLALHVASL